MFALPCSGGTNRSQDRRNTGFDAAPAKWTYAEVLAHVKTPPTVQLDATDTALNATSLVPPDSYEAQYNVLYSTQREGTVTNSLVSKLTEPSIAILIVGFGLPVVITWLSYFPIISHAAGRLRPYIVSPSTIGTYHVHSLPYHIGKAPTIGHALFVVVVLILNVAFTAAGYESRQPNAWNPTVHLEIMSYVLGRTGIFAYQLLPLVVLFAGRNNILLRMTNWSHSTFTILHRWVARIFTIQVLLHSVVSLVKYLETGMYHMEKSKPYWIWGIVATLCVVVLCFGSGLYVRNSYYESFLLEHIVLSVVTVVGCWYPAYDLYGLLGRVGYWIYATAAVWAFDHAGRLLRIWLAGLRRSIMTNIGGDDGYIRINVPGIRWNHKPGMHAYLCFPTLTPWRPWENHPFSVMPTVMLRPLLYSGKAPANDANHSERSGSSGDIERSKVVGPPTIKEMQADRPEVGLTFFIRKSVGLTKKLQAHNDLLTFVEGPYPNNSSDRILRCDRILLLGGGIGITALVPFIASHWNVKLCWSVKDSARCLVDELQDVLSHVDDKEICVGRRLDIAALLATEAEAGCEKLGVVVAGPAAMCDDARAMVSQVAKRNPGTEVSWRWRLTRGDISSAVPVQS